MTARRACSVCPKSEFESWGRTESLYCVVDGHDKIFYRGRGVRRRLLCDKRSSKKNLYIPPGILTYI